MDLYLIRHGATDSNLADRAMGTRVDEPINEIGKAQALAALASLPPKIDALFASPMKRTQQTAEIVSEQYGVPIQTDTNLLERDKGDLDGKTWTEIAEISEGAISVEMPSAQWNFGPYGGESPEHVIERIRVFLNRIAEYPTDSVIVAVTHSGVIHTMYHLLYEKSVRDVPNGSVHKFSI